MSDLHIILSELIRITLLDVGISSSRRRPRYDDGDPLQEVRMDTWAHDL